MTISRAIGTGANIAVIVGLGIFLMGPSGVVTGKWREWRESVEVRERVAGEWDALTGGGVRLDRGSVAPTLVMFSDYQCPFCKQAHRLIEDWLATNEAGIVLRHLPLTAIHPFAEGAALAAICAEEQGRFQAMNRRFFETDRWEEDGDWLREAKLAGVPDVDAFAECLDSTRARDRLDEDLRLAALFDIRGTPTFVHGGGIASGMITPEVLTEFTRSERR